MIFSNRRQLERILEHEWKDLSEEKRGKILHYYDLVIKENRKQNLTRLTQPVDFYEGHLIDVAKLLSTAWIESPVVDLGSGPGVPGLVAGIIQPDSWLLLESEYRKAEFLQRTVSDLRLQNIQVIHARAEVFLRNTHVSTIVARAVGTLEKIFSWIGKCSTWNKLILLKGPRWQQEWTEFQRNRYSNQLLVNRQIEYAVGLEMKKRILVELLRVPRGT